MFTQTEGDLTARSLSSGTYLGKAPAVISPPRRDTMSTAISRRYAARGDDADDIAVLVGSIAREVAQRPNLGPVVPAILGRWWLRLVPRPSGTYAKSARRHEPSTSPRCGVMCQAVMATHAKPQFFWS